jgi:hypothetical protein
MNPLVRLLNYYQSIADGLATQKLTSAVFPNASDAGTSREDILVDFLAAHLPTRCVVIKGGFIFDSRGNESNQVDVIVTNDLTLQFKVFDRAGKPGKSFNCIEGCYCAISVKTTLDKQQLIDSLENLASIPPTPPISTMPYVLVAPSNTENLLQELPYRVVFAFEGVDAQTVWRHLTDYYAVHEVPNSRRPNLIIVNNRYLIIQTGPEGVTDRLGQKYPPYSFQPVAANAKNVGAYSLLYLLTQIQRISQLGSRIQIDFGRYVDSMPFQ